VPAQILGAGGILWSVPPPILAAIFCHSISIDNTFLTVTDYTQLICGPLECVMTVSLYSQQSCNFVNMVTPVLATQNASKLISIIINVP